MKTLPIIVIFAFTFASLHADEPEPGKAGGDKDGHAPAGHSDHGAAFNEGPRQAAYLMKGTGKVDFPVTTSSSEAQKFFEQGVGQLHGFWYFEAERSFRQVAKLDPGCAMAYWGMAMANVNNAKRAKDFIKKAVELKSSATRHEQLWIEALAAYHRDGKKDDKPKEPEKKGGDSKKGGEAETAEAKKEENAKEPPKNAGRRDDKSNEQSRRREYVRNLEKIIREFPKDLEAKAFLAVQIWENSSKNLPINSHEAVESLINEVLSVEKMHPVHHYRIHLWDAEYAEHALGSAALCGQAAPGIAHMWHMPGHIFSRLERYSDSAWQQEAAIRVDNAQLIHDRVLPDQIHNYAHNAEWLIRNLSHIGRARDGIALAKNLIELPRHPKYNNIGSEDDRGNYNAPRNSAWYGRARLLELLTRYELWDELIALSQEVYLEPTPLAEEQAKRLRALGLAWFGKGDREKGRAQIVALEELIKRTRDAKQAAAGKAEAKAKGDKQAEEKIKKAGADASSGFTRRIESLEKHVAELKMYDALAEGKIDAARELLGKAGDIAKERRARIHLALGEKDKAEQLAREAVKSAPNQVHPLANAADILFQCGKRDDAIAFFNQLRELASGADIDLPVFQRLTPLAQQLGLRTDWRVPAPKLADIGKRPELKKLGPFKWSAAPAPDWTLTDISGRQVSLKDYRGKPVLLVFYLGYQCSHCIEQLDVLLPMHKEFADAGISMVAISSDGATDLTKTFDRFKQNQSYTLVSDKQLKVFKAYRAYDDFENIPLHGTFLVDGTGNVRWQDVSFEPFKEGKFLLEECKRLLKQSGQDVPEPVAKGF